MMPVGLTASVTRRSIERVDRKSCIWRMEHSLGLLGTGLCQSAQAPKNRNACCGQRGDHPEDSFPEANQPHCLGDCPLRLRLAAAQNMTILNAKMASRMPT